MVGRLLESSAADGPGRSRAPTGRSVGLPKSSWFHQLPSRPTPCARSSPGARQSASSHTSAPARLATKPPTRQPSAMPPHTPSPPFQIANGPHHSSGTSSQLVSEVVEAGADDAGGDAPDRAAEDEVPVAAARDPPAAGDVDAERDRREQREPVHVDRERAEVERAGARRRDREEDVHRARILCADMCPASHVLDEADPFREVPRAPYPSSRPYSPIASRTSGAFVNWISR